MLKQMASGASPGDDEEISQTEQTFGGTEVIIWRSAARRWIVAGSHHQVANDSSVQG